MKGNILFYFGRISQKLKNYPFAIKLYKKALQYSWLFNENVNEINIYDLLGMCYYYLGEVKKAYHYHEKSIKK